MDAPPAPPPDAAPPPPPAPVCTPPTLTPAEISSGRAVIASYLGQIWISTLCGPLPWSYFWFEAIIFRDVDQARAVLGAASFDLRLIRFRLYPKHCKVKRSPCTHAAPT